MAKKPVVTLYGYPTSPYVLKVKCFLDYKGIEHSWVPVRPVKNESIQFTNQRKVPVLKIDDEWRTESTDLGIWLDDVFPDKLITGSMPIEKSIILEHDQWVSDTLIPGRFREALDGKQSLSVMLNGWRLARIVHSATPIPMKWRLLWPVALKKAEFIQDIVNGLDRTEPIAEMRLRNARELVTRLEGGPFLGGLKQPSLADLAAFPTLAFTYRAGFKGDFAFVRHPEIIKWVNDVAAFLPANPFLCQDRFLTRELPTIG